MARACRPTLCRTSSIPSSPRNAVARASAWRWLQRSSAIMAASSNASRYRDAPSFGFCCPKSLRATGESEMPEGTILIADDDSAIRTVLSQALGRVGYDVRTTGTAAGLWRWVAAGEGNLVITDVVLPDESGFDLIPRIKRVRPDLPVVVMSAQNTILTAITAAERGAFDYLPKPFDLKELTALVQRALAVPQRALEQPSQSDGP